MNEEPPLERRLKVAVAAAQIGTWTWCQATNRISWDEQACETLGLLPEAQLELSDLGRLIHPEDQPRWQAALDAARNPNSGGTLKVDVRIHRPVDQGERWISLYGHFEIDDGGVTRLCGAVRDVTPAYLMAAQSDQIEARLTAIVSIAADAIISLNEAQQITLFNDGAEKLFGYSRSEVMGQPIDMLIPERFRPRHSAHVRRFGTAGNVARAMGQRDEIFARRKDGGEFSAEASISHLQIGEEKIYTVVLRDVSERKRALDILANSRQELERHVAERTAELKAEMRRREDTQAQLVRTQRMEAFGQLTGGVAHDFNNLLTVITGNLELLDMRVDDEKARTLLKRAQDAAEMGARLTSRLLTFAKRRQFSTAPLNLNEQVMGMVDLLRRTIGEDVDLNARLAPQLWTVRADPSEIENAVLNLAINARDAMAKGGRLVIETANILAEDGQIGTIDRLPAGDYVRLSVSDTGAGMTPEIVSRAFEPFFTTKQPGKGTGLGLSTIYGFVQQSGGTASIYSEAGLGSTVSLYLPRAADTAEFPVAGRDAAIAPSAGETVLVVEDNAEVREVTHQRLAGLGYIVIEAENGPAAIEVLESGARIDLVFSDVVMGGGMSGFDVARQVRLRWPGTRVLMTSGYPDDILRGQEPGLQDLRILRKPYSRSELARILRDTFDG